MYVDLSPTSACIHVLLGGMPMKNILNGIRERTWAFVANSISVTPLMSSLPP